MKETKEYYKTDPDAGKRVKEAREYAQLTRTGLAERCFLSQSLISSVENGSRRLTDGVAREISKACGVRLEYILGMDDFMTEDQLLEHRKAEVGNLLKQREMAETWYDSFVYAVANQIDHDFSVDSEGRYSFTRYDGRTVIIQEADYKNMREEFFDFAAFTLERLIQRNAHNSYMKK